MSSVRLLETILYDPKEGFFLLDKHCERMLNSAKALAAFYADDQEKFLSDLIPTPSELVTKLEGAVKNAGNNIRQRLRVLLAFDGTVMIQSSQLPSETSNFSESSIVIVLDTEPTPNDNIFLRHKTTERSVYDDARSRRALILFSTDYDYVCVGLGPLGAPRSPDEPFDVIMYNQYNEITETTIANIAIEVESSDSGNLEWITPPLSSGLLAGTMRQNLLENGELRERVITVNDLKKAVQDNRRIKCFNSVRKEFPVKVVL
ncbi:hypothetical protein BGZ46_009935 [Entomortierella lignicola]|nr:hypothetical protein BGZ46_009935 [Entomortierella lignicola]